MKEILACVGFCIIMLSGIICARKHEKKNWNKGSCAECGTKWKSFDMDSQGGRGYRCDGCGRYIWISYNIDKGYRSER